MTNCKLELALGECAANFSLENAVCNHGFFMMAPNLWNSSTKTLQRPLRLADSTTSINISISHHPYPDQHSTSLLVTAHNKDHLSSQDQLAILGQVSRMLRISAKDEIDVRVFQNVHPEAKRRGFGRLFRSPTLFEAVVKSILLCNCNWERTLKMAEALCNLQLKLSDGGKENHNSSTSAKKQLTRKRGHSKLDNNDNPFIGNFPIAKEIAGLDEDILKGHCMLGYRARVILEFAKRVASGQLQLEKFEKESDLTSCKKLNGILLKMKGFGPFSCANVSMCMGFYHRVPQDTETARHLLEVHSIRNGNQKVVKAAIKRIYQKYAPFQCLAYWMEILDYYESKLGKLSQLPKSDYKLVTGNKHNLNFGENRED